MMRFASTPHNSASTNGDVIADTASARKNNATPQNNAASIYSSPECFAASILPTDEPELRNEGKRMGKGS